LKVIGLVVMDENILTKVLVFQLMIMGFL